MNKKIPDDPMLFLKPSSSVIAHEDNIIYPSHMSSRVDFEGELAVVISKEAKHIKPSSALDYVLGYTCINDVTARDLQAKDGQFTRAKGFDTFAPLGPWIETRLSPFDFNVFVGKLDYNISNVLVSYVLILLLFSFVIISLKRKNYLIFYFLSWIVITLVPAIGVSIVNLTTSPFSERFIYIPSIGYCILVSLLVFKLIDFQKNRKIKYVIISFVLAVFLIFTLKQQFVWKNSSTLWAAAVKRSPGYVSPHLNYGHALLENGKLDEALNQFLIALDPDTQGRDIERVNVANNLGN